jgi:hypothetical protein
VSLPAAAHASAPQVQQALAAYLFETVVTLD